MLIPTHIGVLRRCGCTADTRNYELTAGTTHVVLVPGATGHWEPSPGELLDVLGREQGGVPALSMLRQGLLAGSMHIVRSRCAPRTRCQCLLSSSLLAGLVVLMGMLPCCLQLGAGMPRSSAGCAAGRAC